MAAPAFTLLDTPVFEVIPIDGVLEKVAVLPPRTLVSITASPAKGMKATIDLALRLREIDLVVTPHISARMVKDRSELRHMTRLLSEYGVADVLVVGGDVDESGAFKDAVALLREMADIGHSFTDVGITGYPEGHPFISGDGLREALVEKARFATYITTQMCFDPAAIEAWLRGTRLDGVKLPVMVGVPGAIDAVRLARVASRIGVGTSIRYLLKNRRNLLRLIRSTSYRPGKLVNALEGIDRSLGLLGLHIFTFNQVAPTWKWYEQARAKRKGTR